MFYGILIIMISGIMFYIYKKSQRSTAHLMQNKDKKEVIAEKKTIFSNIINKIDVNAKHPVFSHERTRIKCIRAGIVSVYKQKIFIFSRYLAIIPGIILAIMVGTMILKVQSIKLLFLIGGAGAILGFYYPLLRIDAMIKDRQAEISRAFPDFMDIILVCVSAGMTLKQAYIKVHTDFDKFSPTFAAEIKILSSELTYFLEPQSAYNNFYHRTQNDHIRAYNSIVLQSIQLGTPLVEGLRYLSKEVREKQMGEVEKKAAALAAKLTLPMMLFTLPVLLVVLGFPAAMQMMQTF